MAQQLRNLVQQMLELAKAENAQTKVEVSKLDLSQPVSDAMLPFEPVF